MPRLPRVAVAIIVLCWLISTGVLAWTAFTARSDADSAIAQIQASRRSNLLDACESQNQRHDNTLTTLDRIYAAAEKANPSRAKAIAAGEAPTALVVNALAPVHRPCSAYVASELRDP